METINSSDGRMCPEGKGDGITSVYHYTVPQNCFPLTKSVIAGPARIGGVSSQTGPARHVRSSARQNTHHTCKVSPFNQYHFRLVETTNKISINTWKLSFNHKKDSLH